MEGNIHIVLFLLAALGLIVLFYTLWRDLVIDWARERLFAQRDALFDMAVAGKLDFEGQNYRDLRAFLNSLIRNAHRLSAFWMIYQSKPMAAMSRRSRSVDEVLADIPDPDARREATALVHGAIRILLWRMALTSLVALLTHGTLKALSRLGMVRARAWRTSAVTRARSEVEREGFASAA